VESITLQKASAAVSQEARNGQWAFIPVTDGSFLQDLPTVQLLGGKANGVAMLSGNNANEGYYFVPQNITTEAIFRDYIQLNYGSLSTQQIDNILSVYQPELHYCTGTLYDSDGLSDPTANTVDGKGCGWQAAANNLYSETTFVCPAYWLADAFTATVNPNGGGKKAWRYQFSVPEALHGADLEPLSSDPNTQGTKENTVFRKSFQALWGNFIVSLSPTLGETSNSGGDDIEAATATHWKSWGMDGGFDMLNLNTTVSNNTKFSVVDGIAWEGGRGARCAIWAALGQDALT